MDTGTLNLYTAHLESTPYGQVFQKIIRKDGFAKNIIENYNNEVINKIPQIILNTTIPTQKGIIQFRNVQMFKPTIEERSKVEDLYPRISHNKGIPYFATLKFEMVHKKLTGNVFGQPTYASEPDDVHVTEPLKCIPVMLGSELCHLNGKSAEEKMALGECFNDIFGYFISKSERVIINQENLRLSTFMIYVPDAVKGLIEGRITCPTTQGTTVTSITITKTKALAVSLQHLRKKPKKPILLPIFEVFKILGMDVQEAMGLILSFIPEQFREAATYILQSSISEYGNEISNGDDSVEALITNIYNRRLNDDKMVKRENIIRDIERDLFSNVKNVPNKLMHLAMYSSRMIEVLVESRKLDDRDSWANKRVATPGRSIYQLFKGIWANLINRTIAKTGDAKNLKDVVSKVNFTEIRDNFITAFGSAGWGVKGSYSKENIVDSLKRTTPLELYSQIGRLSTPTSRQSKNPVIRMPHGSQTGYFCLTGDTDILMEDNITTKKIGVMDNTDKVITVNPVNLVEEKSSIENYFQVMPDKILRIKTISDRSVKSTPDHPFLVARIGKTEWVKAGELKTGDYLVVKNYTLPLSNEGKLLTVDKSLILDKHIEELTKLGFLDTEIPESKMSILARIIGSIWTDGTVSDRAPYGYPGWYVGFCVGEEADAIDLQYDIVNQLGFDSINYYYKESKYVTDKDIDVIHKYYTLNKGGAFANLMLALGVPVGKKGAQCSKPVPEWILNASPNVKREFLSGMQGGDGGRIAIRKNGKQYKISCGVLFQTCSPEFKDSHESFMTQVKDLYVELGIDAKIEQKPAPFDKIKHNILITGSYENIYKMSQIVGYRYCHDKQRASAIPIEYCRYRMSRFKEKQNLYQTVRKYYSEGKSQKEICGILNINQKLVSRICTRGDDYEISIVDYGAMDYDEFCKRVFSYGDKVYIPIDSIEECETEMVYDFTTISNNHSFYANGILVHNCLYETPDGEGVGLVKNFASSLFVSLERDAEPIVQILNSKELASYFTTERKHEELTPVTVNGVIEGWCVPEGLVISLKYYKSLGIINKDVCIFHNKRDRCVEIFCDGGRPTRPLFVVDRDNQLVIDKLNMWNSSIDDLIKAGCIEYLDAREQEWVYLAQDVNTVREFRENKIRMEKLSSKKTLSEEESVEFEILQLKFAQGVPEYTHCEIDPVAMFSLAANLVPQANRQAGPRTQYQANMSRQALTQYHSNEHLRFDAVYKMIYYPCKPIFQNDLQETAGLNLMPNGQTLQVAIMALPDNPEDGIVFKEEAIKYNNKFDLCKKSLTVSDISRSKDSTYEELFAKPPIKPGEPESRYSAIGDDGIPILDAYIRPGDCIIGKIRKFNKSTDTSVAGKVVNLSQFAGVGEEGYVDRVLITKTGNGDKIIKVKLRHNRKYIPGDKIASRYSQKGTIAKVVSARYLPRVASGPLKGMVPDIFINPHGQPSRMTMNMMIEILVTKSALISGRYINSTTFREFNDEIKLAQKTLEDYGLDPNGKEEFELPNGKKLKNRVYFGPCFYQALKHHVTDKISMRARKGVKPSTRQPLGGRSLEGGLKVGEMERDALISHGASALLRERLCDVSDAFNLPICKRCGTIAITNHRLGIYKCNLCGDKAEIGLIRIPYVVKLLLFYLNAAGIHMTFKVNEIISPNGRPEEKFLM